VSVVFSLRCGLYFLDELRLQVDNNIGCTHDCGKSMDVSRNSLIQTFCDEAFILQRRFEIKLLKIASLKFGSQKFAHLLLKRINKVYAF
jgi:hypothetical protein